MAGGIIRLRIYPDGRVEAEIDGIRGKGCTAYITLVERLVGGETTDSQRTANYYLEEEAEDQASITDRANIEGKD